VKWNGGEGRGGRNKGEKGEEEERQGGVKREAHRFGKERDGRRAICPSEQKSCAWACWPNRLTLKLLHQVITLLLILM
jgi:hypothetical protein